MPLAPFVKKNRHPEAPRVTFRRVAVPFRGPGQSPGVLSANHLGAHGRPAVPRLRVSGARSLAHWGLCWWLRGSFYGFCCPLPGWEGGSKVFAQKAPSSGVAHCCHIKRRLNGNAAGRKVLGRRFQSLSFDCRWRRRRHFRPTGVRIANKKVCGQLHYYSASACLEPDVLPTAWGRVCH